MRGATHSHTLLCHLIHKGVGVPPPIRPHGSHSPGAGLTLPLALGADQYVGFPLPTQLTRRWGYRLTLPLALGADLPQEHGDEEAAGRGSKKKMRGRREATGNDIEEAAGRGGKDKERRGAAGR